MKTVVREMLERLGPSSASEFKAFHADLGTGADLLGRFLSASVDEVRLRCANDYAKSVLAQTDLEDMDYFRKAVMRRELLQLISYPKQRDHAAHTLNNYILGWYLYESCPRLKAAMRQHFKLRRLARETRDFAESWPLVSLLHDVGYIFEGSLERTDPRVQGELVTLGVNLVEDYFDHRYWVDGGFDSTYDRARLLALSGVDAPTFSGRSMASAGDSLRHIGDVERIRKAAKAAEPKGPKKNPAIDWLVANQPIGTDAFDIWEHHYEYFGLTKMVDRVRTARRLFAALLDRGLAPTGTRVLDHGVCSGLILLKACTFHFQIQFGLQANRRLGKGDQLLKDRFIGSAESRGLVYDPYWWWASIVWATFAAAVHNIQQMELGGVEGVEGLKPLAVDEDPLAFLGIMVDCLQEWDRYSVSRGGALGGELPLQGVDVRLRCDQGIVVLSLGNDRRREKVRNALGTALADWAEFVRLD